MVDPVTLLPENATGWELAHEITDAKRWSLLDPQWIVEQTDPMTCDLAVLPVIAWGRSVDLWYEDWPTEKKRQVVANWYAYERLKSKAEGFRQFFALVGAEVRRITTAPQGIFAADDRTEQERLAYLARFPQLRIYPYKPRRENQYGVFLDVPGAPWGIGQFADDMWAEAGNSIGGFEREARLWDNGVEAVLTRREIVRDDVYAGVVVAYEEVILPVVAEGIFADAWAADVDFVLDFYMGERTVRLRVERPNGAAIGRVQINTVFPSLNLVEQQPETVCEPGLADGWHADDAFAGEIFAMDDTSWMRMYERYYLFDPARAPTGGGSDLGWFADDGRLGITRHTAEIKIAMKGRRHELAWGEFAFGFIMDDPEVPIERAYAAAVAAKSARDTILIDTTTVRDARIGDRLILGSYRFGDLVET